MAAQTRTSTTVAAPSRTYARFAGIAGTITGISSLLYAVFFLLVSGRAHEVIPPLLLAIGGLLASALLVALHARVRAADESFAQWALLLGIIGQIGTAIHGITGLADQLVPPPASAPNVSALVNQVDPRGFLAFGLTGVSTFIFGWLIVRGRRLPARLGYLGCVLGVLLVALFLGNLFTNDAKSLAVLIPGGLSSLIANPIWLIWLGLIFWRTE